MGCISVYSATLGVDDPRQFSSTPGPWEFTHLNPNLGKVFQNTVSIPYAQDW